MSLKRASLALAMLLLLPASALAEAKLLRHPSYHNGKVAFSYLGDIWTANEQGGQVERLTVHKGRDVFPRFSPDGQWIAFSSNRYGNYDIFAIPSRGGAARQLTFHTGGDTVVGWTPDSKRVIFSAARGRLFSGVPNLHEISIEGGLEQPLGTDWSSSGSYSPDGRKLAFNRHSMGWWRRHYRGGRAADLWIMDGAAKSFQRLSEEPYKENWAWPMYGARGEIFFVTDRMPNERTVKPGSPEVLQSANNIWKISERGGTAVQVTRHTSGALFFPSLSADRRVIVYEADHGLWKLDTATGKSSEIKINIVTDEKENNLETLTIQSDADSFHLSPSTRRAAISAHGEIFTVATDRGEIQRVTESYARESNPQWAPDGKWIAFVSDRSGRDEVWIADERGKNLKKLSDSDTEKPLIRWAPDSKSLLYSSSDHKLYRVQIESGKTEAIASSEVSNISNPQFSPDSQWISYTKPDRNLRSHVYVIPAAGGSERHFGGEDLFSELGAMWTPDGKKLIFLSGNLQGGIASPRNQQTRMQLHSVSLEKEDKNPADRGVDVEEEAPAGDPSERPRGAPPGPGAGGGRPETSKIEVKIEWDGLSRRIRQLTRLADGVSSAVPSPDSRLYAFVSTGEQDGRQLSTLYTIQEDGERQTRITQSLSPGGEEVPRFGGLGGGISSPQFSREGRSIYFLERDGIYAVGVAGGGASAPAAAPSSAPSGFGRGAERRRVTFTARVEVDHQAERSQVFNESWRVMKNRFYDPKMHGVDWVKMKEIYEPLLFHVADQEEMHNVILEMIGELNASHTGISAGGPGGRGEGQQPQTRYPGFELEADPAGYYKVASIYKNGPADKDYVKLSVGNFILAIDDQELKAGDNYWKLYNAVPGRKFELTLNSKPGLEGSWKTKVEPVSGAAHSTLLYEKWVEERKNIVTKVSGGEIGYLHIRAMNAESLRRFERELVENHFKKALIIDQRFNGGGGIEQELLQILGQRQYQFIRGRDSVEVSRPQRAFFGPMVVMQNEMSGSNAEMFPEGFRTLGLGKVVGVTTAAAVIGTGSYRLLDGSQIRTPGSGVWTITGQNMENYGVPPDVYVDNGPQAFLQGRDLQIEKAVEILKEEMKPNRVQRR